MGDESFLPRIYDTFAEIASSLGYSPLHGKIIGLMLTGDGPISLKELARETGYSLGMISLSLDVLELIGVIKKVKKRGDRQLYVRMEGDLLSCLKIAIMFKVKKSIARSLEDLGEYKKKIIESEGKDKKTALKVISTLEQEIKRLDKYIKELNKVKLP